MNAAMARSQCSFTRAAPVVGMDREDKREIPEKGDGTGIIMECLGSVNNRVP